MFQTPAPSPAPSPGSSSPCNPDQPSTCDTLTPCPQQPLPVPLLLHPTPTPQLLQWALQHRDLNYLHQQQQALDAQYLQRVNNRGDDAGVYEQGMAEMEHKVRECLRRVGELRSRWAQGALGRRVESMRGRHDRHVRRANLLRYRELLVSVRQSYAKLMKEGVTEGIVEQQGQKLTECGMITTSEILNSALLQMTIRAIHHHKCQLTINNPQNLKSITHSIMDPTTITKYLPQSHVPTHHPLYHKLKQYILLKTYINCRSIQQPTIDTLCQQDITEYLSLHAWKLTHVEINKTMSLVQCDEGIREYLEGQMHRQVTGLLAAVVRGMGARREWAGQWGVGKGGAVGCGVIAEEDGSGEQISDALQGLHKAQPIMTCLAPRLPFTHTSLTCYLLVHALRHYLNPLVKLSFALLKHNYSKDRQQRHYHYVRNLYMDMAAYGLLYGAEMEQWLEQMRVRVQAYLGNSCQQGEISEEIKVKNKVGNRQAIAQWLCCYNEQNGQMFIYLCNKLAANLNQHQFWPGFPSVTFDQLANLWPRLLANLFLCLAPNLTPPPSLTFMRPATCQHLASIFTIEQCLQSCLDHNQYNSTSSTKCHIQECQRDSLYARLMQVNLRTRQYGRLVQLARLVGAEKEIRGLWERLYRDVCKRLKL